MNKYEKLIEHIINDNEQAARALFHEIVVAKSRDIYESLMDDEQMEEVGGNAVNSLVDEISADEEGVQEAEDEFASDDEEFDIGGDEEGADDEMGDDLGGEEDFGGEEESTEQNIKNALAELEAEFNKLIGNDEGADGEDEFGGEEFGGEEEMGSEEEDEEAEDGFGGDKSEIEMMREYVEKVADQGQKTEGGEAGNGGSATINKQGIVASKNDMGGSAANIARGGAEQAADGTTPRGKAGGFVKAAQEIDVAKRNVNKPGGNKGAQDFYGTKAKAKSGEGQTTDGSVSVNKSSIEGGK